MVDTSDQTRNGTRKVLFVLHQMGTLDHVAALHNQLVRAGAIVHVAFGEKGLDLPLWFEQEISGVTVIDDPLDAILERRYDAVIMQMPYDELKDPVWSTIGRDEAFVVYAGYGVWTLTWDHGGYGLPFHARSSLILASSPWARDKYLASEFAPADAVWSGDPLMYELTHAHPTLIESPTIMWAPHWAETWVDGSPGFSTWKSTVHIVLAAARRHNDVTFIVRGHPLMKTDGVDRLSRRAARSYNELVASPNVTLSTVSMRADILRATALLTDGVSIIPYYSTTGKPLGISRRHGTWRHLDSSGKALINQSDVLSTPRQIRRWLDAATVLDPQISKDRQDLVSHLFPLKAKSPGEIMLERLRIS